MSVAPVRGRALLALALFAACCRAQTQAPPPSYIAGWKPIGSWSGHGNAQLETFPIERRDWRLKWETKNEQPAGSGTLHVTINSGDSGRLIVDAVDTRGVGHDIVDISEQPHRFYLVVESSDVDWSVAVEEPVIVEGQPGR